MTALSVPLPVPDRWPRHASLEEYRAFVAGYCGNARQIRHLMGCYGRFVRRYPDLADWFNAPLSERVGQLHGETGAACTCLASYKARGYLLFLGVAGYATFDWEWILAMTRIDIWKMLGRLGVDSGISRLVAHAVRLGYDEVGATAALRKVCSRLFLHSGVPNVDRIGAGEIAALLDAARRFGERDDLALYHASPERYHHFSRQDVISSAHVLRVALYHRGQIAQEPGKSTERPKRNFLTEAQATNPRMTAVIEHYLAERLLDSEPSTVKALEVDLGRFVTWIAGAHPDLETLADVTRDHVTAYAEALRTMIGRRTKRPLADLTRRGALATLSVFFQDVIRRGYADVPSHPLLYAGDIPKVPQRIPRFIPDSELDRLVDAIRALACPYQRAALLVARWSGGRRSEIRRLAVDCLDSYPDGARTPRLRLPVGKTRRDRLVPIHPEAAAAIQHLQGMRQGERGLSDPKTGQETRFLFVHHGKLLTNGYLFDTALDQVVRAAGLLDADDVLPFTAHRFRHSVGTQLAEKGAKLHTIMRILGHQNPSMAMVYATISDKTVLEDYQAVLGPNATIAGPMAQTLRIGGLTDHELHWVKSNFFKTELELGHCLRLPQEGPCECDLYLTCAKFVTTKAYAPRLRRRRGVELQLADDAQERGWDREVERHRGSARRIEKLLADLGEPVEGHIAID
jgi:integrase